MIRAFTFLSVLVQSAYVAMGQTVVLEYDVLVYSANAAGVAAAVTASGSQAPHFSVSVVEPLEMIGGMAAAGGVALMNQGGCGLTGLSKNWSMLCGEYYYGYPTMMTPVNAPFPSMNVSEMAFWTLLRSRPHIDVTTGCWATEVHRASEEATPGCLNQVDFECNNGTKFSVRASYLIDASYDGDLMVMADVEHTSGRESKETYNESLAGVTLQDYYLESFAQQNLTIDPYFENGTLLPFIEQDALLPQGTGDDRLMAFEYFACVSNTPGNIVPFDKPLDYDPEDFTLLMRVIDGVLENNMFPTGVPLNYFGDVQCYDKIVSNVTGNRDCLFCCGTASEHIFSNLRVNWDLFSDIRSHTNDDRDILGPVDSDQPGLNRGWATATRSQRLKMADDHKYWIKGMLYFLGNDPRVPEATRQNVNSYGYCKDEYTKYDNFPPQLYVRISNRLIGESLLTQNNIIEPQAKDDAVAMGCWIFDQHTVSRHAVPANSTQHTRTGMVVENEGFMRAILGSEGLPCDHPDADCESFDTTWYDVPYGVMSPKRKQASNLLIPVAISASSVAYSSTRIENMFMDLGSAAGVAVAQLLRERQGAAVGSCPKLAVQDVDVSAVQKVLQNVYGQALHGPPGRT